jgi:hypothetical protein
MRTTGGDKAREHHGSPQSDACPPGGRHLDPGVPDRVDRRLTPAPAGARRPDPRRDERSHRADDGGDASAICQSSGTERHIYHHDYGATADDHDGRVSRQLLSGRPGRRGVRVRSRCRSGRSGLAGQNRRLTLRPSRARYGCCSRSCRSSPVPATRRRSPSNTKPATVAEADASSAYRTSSCVMSALSVHPRDDPRPSSPCRRPVNRTPVSQPATRRRRRSRVSLT